LKEEGKNREGIRLINQYITEQDTSKALMDEFENEEEKLER
jgi:hypothetical protein